jgi:TetR/AcrR family transcriptional regulator
MEPITANQSETARKILEAAREEFAENGLYGARVDQIARRAGINKAMIYYHFHSKDALYQAIIEDHLAQIANFLEMNIPGDHDIASFLYNMAGFFDLMFRQRRSFAPIFLRELASGGARVRDAFTRIMSAKGLNKTLLGIIDEGKEKGLFRDIDSTQAMVSFIGMNLYYLLASPVINSVLEIKDEKNFREKRQKEVVDLFLYGLKAR